ncbi:MAG: hypothetical protein Q4Q33_04475 [Eubacteriales bacterium]|nr:hypothetical protein [Eubacteriales bacterium]
MPGKKENEEVTAEEYRQKAQEQIHELKDQWKIFFRTGIIILAAVIVIIAVSIAWFTMNNQVEATGTSIQAAGSEFELAAAVKGADSTQGTYDNLLEVSPGAELKVGDENYLSTDGSHTAISWAITDDSNMRNENNGQTQGIEPGSSGKMTFYIISHKEGMLDVKLDLNVTGYKATKDVSTATDLEPIDESAQQLLEGHILLFAGYDEGANSYKGWISEDAGSWSMDLGSEGKTISLQEDGNGELTWKTENAEKDTAYPVTVYWIWPERLESYLRKADTYTGRYPLLFPDDAKENDTGNPSALPANLFAKMCDVGDGSGTNAGSNRYFRWENQETFGKTVTEGTLLGLRNEFHSLVYREAAAYYDSADQYLGKNVQYVKLKLTAE